MDRYIIVHYHEVGLKKKNRDFFEARLKENIEHALKGSRYEHVRKISGRLLVKLNEQSNIDEIRSKIRNVFGIAYFAAAWLSDQDLEQLERDIGRLIEGKRFASFCVRTKRGEKSFPLNSQQINERVGAYLQEKSQARVDLTHPELTCYIEIVERFAFIYFEKEKGPGGLPVATGGKVIALLSGGIDSPVAAYKILKRGCRVIFLHFHSFPHTTIDSQDKVRKLCRILSKYQFVTRLYLVPFADIQRRIVAFAQPPIRVILYRRFMMRIAEAVARSEGAAALVTGDSIGQVASQTLENISAVSRVTQIPILRPLIGDDKQEIIELASRIGTLDISIQPDQDCCTLFIPKHPQTKANLWMIEEAEKQLDIPQLVQEAVAGATLERMKDEG